MIELTEDMENLASEMTTWSTEKTLKYIEDFNAMREALNPETGSKGREPIGHGAQSNTNATCVA
jgi:hypothetical protein